MVQEHPTGIHRGGDEGEVGVFEMYGRSGAAGKRQDMMVERSGVEWAVTGVEGGHFALLGRMDEVVGVVRECVEVFEGV